MTSSNFQKCLAFVLKYEGGKSDDPRDPGGKTIEGITQRTYDAFLDKKGKPRRDVFEIPSSDRDEIYRTFERTPCAPARICAYSTWP
jgi:lysozyme family protein